MKPKIIVQGQALKVFLEDKKELIKFWIRYKEKDPIQLINFDIHQSIFYIFK